MAELAASRVLVIIPTYNEMASLPRVIDEIRRRHSEAHILVIDDASPDGTGDWIAKFAATDSAVSVIHRPTKLGLGTAYIEGFRHALACGYDVIVECDGDGSHRVAELTKLLRGLESGVDVAVGSRWVPGGSIKGWPWYRQLLSRTGTQIARLALGSKLHDLTSGYRAFRREALMRLPLQEITSEGYGFQIEVAWTLERFGCIIAEVPITFVERTGGRSKMSWAIVAEALRLVLWWGVLRRIRASKLPQPLSPPAL